MFFRSTRSTYLHELHGHEPEALLLEPLDDVAHEAALHAVGLDHDEGALVVAHLGFLVVGRGGCGDGFAAVLVAEDEMEECQESCEH